HQQQQMQQHVKQQYQYGSGIHYTNNSTGHPAAPEVPPHGHVANGAPYNLAAPARSAADSINSRDSYCEQVAVVNMSLNQCAVPSKRKDINAPDYPNSGGGLQSCEREPLLVGQGAPASLAAHVLPRSANAQQQHYSNQRDGNVVRPNNQTPRLLIPPQRSQQLQQEPHGVKSTPKPQLQMPRSQHKHNHHHHHHSHHHHQQHQQKQHRHHHHYPPQQQQKKWPVSTHFPDWDQRDVDRQGASWKSRSEQGRVRQSADHGHVRHKPHCRAAALAAAAPAVGPTEARNSAGLILPGLPKHYQVEEAGVRSKLRNLTRHYSDDSLPGLSNRELYAARIHSSADEISSVNRSPSISSSDESFSRTDFSRTDADSPSPKRAPSLNDVRFRYMFGDMNPPEEETSARFREVSPQLYSDYLSSVKASSDESSLRLNSLTLDSCNHSRSNVASAWRESDIGPPLTDSDRLRRDDLFIPKLRAEFSSDKVKRTKTGPSPSMQESSMTRSSASPASDKLKQSFHSSFNENDRTSPYRGNISGSASRLMSLDRSPRGSGAYTPESVGAVATRRSLPRDCARKPPSFAEQFSNKKNSSVRDSESGRSSRESDRRSSDRQRPSLDTQAEPKRTHARKASGDDRVKRVGKSPTFGGIDEDAASVS
ncbi:hypothetical protein FHG87_013605, partial [Trinorchestia longiramus]